MMGSYVIGANVTGLLTHSDSEHLYENMTSLGESVTVHVYGILRSENVFSALFRESLQCILSVSVSSGTLLTATEVTTRAQKCNSTVFASSQQQPIKNLFLTSCGNGMTFLNEDTCSVIYNPAKVNSQPAAVFYTAADAVAPVLFFKIMLDKFVTLAEEAALVASTRENLAYSLNVQIDTVLVELVTDNGPLLPVRRRLLNIEQSLLVWVYPEPPGRGYPVFPPETITAGEIYAQKRGNLQRGLVNLIGIARMSDTAETAETGFSVRPALPTALGHFTECIINVDIVPLPLRGNDKETISNSIIKELSTEFLLPTSQMRLTSMNHMEDSGLLRIVTEIRVATSLHARQLSTMLRDNALTLALKIRQRISEEGLSAGTRLLSVTLDPGSFVKAVDGDNERINGVEVVFAIIGITVSIVGLILIWFACYSHPFRNEENINFHNIDHAASQIQKLRPIAVTTTGRGGNTFVANLDSQLQYSNSHIYTDYIPMRLGP